MNNWHARRLDSYINAGDITLGRGEVISKDDIESYPGPYPIYSSSAHNNGKFGEYGYYIFDEELVTWSVDGGGNLFYRPKHKYSVTNVCGFMRINNKNLDAKFIYYTLSNQHRYLTFDYTTKAHPSVIKKLYWLPEISFEKQLKIANILQTIDQSIEGTKALIKKYQQIKTGLMHDLFTRGIGSDGKPRPSKEQAPELYKETPIGWIPKDWAVDLFGLRVAVIDPNPSHRYPEEVQEGIPICSTENFDGEDGFRFEKSKLVPYKTYLDQNYRCKFSLTDVIFARKGKIGLARRYGHDKKAFSHTVVVMKPNDSSVDEYWLLWLARSAWLLNAIDVTMNTNSGVPTLGVAFIKNIMVPFPEITEQKLMFSRLDSVSHKIHMEIQRLNKLNKQKLGLMSYLLIGKAPVKIDEDEVADV